MLDNNSARYNSCCIISKNRKTQNSVLPTVDDHILVKCDSEPWKKEYFVSLLFKLMKISFVTTIYAIFLLRKYLMLLFSVI